jgi:hypothetical protein
VELVMQKKFLAKVSAALAGPLVLLMVSGGTAKADSGDECHDPEWGGTFYCLADEGYMSGEAWFTFPNDTLEVFVIGANNQVYTRWDNTEGELSAWTSMGGTAVSFPPLFYIAGLFYSHAGGSDYSITLTVEGTDGQTYYRLRGPNVSSGWTGSWQVLKVKTT